MSRPTRRLRSRTALLVLVAAVLLGALTGAYLLPDPGTVIARIRATAPPGVPAPSPSLPSNQSSGTPAASPSPSRARSATPTPSDEATTGNGPVGEDDLVTVKAFAEAGLDVTVYPMNGANDPKSAVTACTDESEVGARTLADLTGRAPAVTGNWSLATGDGTALEVLATAETPALAAAYANRLTAAQTLCQDEPAGHFVYGRVHTEKVPAGSSAQWLGRWDGAQNTAGKAPEDTDPCGGVVIASNGSHFAVLELYMCTDAAGLAVLARNAAQQLG